MVIWRYISCADIRRDIVRKSDPVLEWPQHRTPAGRPAVNMTGGHGGAVFVKNETRTVGAASLSWQLTKHDKKNATNPDIPSQCYG